MPKIEIYRATKNELPNIVKIMNLARNETSNSDHFVADDEDFIQRHIDAEGFIAVISVDSAIAGFQIVRIPGKSDDNLSRYVPNEKIPLNKVAHMESSVILPEHRGQHFQRKLLKECEEWIKERGYFWVLSTVHPDNLPSYKSLISTGYFPLRHLKMYGNRDRIIMGKKIK